MTGELLDDQVAVVTGAGRGIGARIAARLAEQGADVVLAGRQSATLEATAAEVRRLGRRPLVVPTDLRVRSDVGALAEQALSEFGRVDLLVNNSGMGGPSAVLWEADPVEWEETIAVNVVGTYWCCRAFLPGMIDRQRGSIVFIGSMTGKRPLFGRTPYATSKMALVGLARTLALEAGPHGVRVNLISPGAVEGERIEWVFQAQATARDVPVEQVRAEFLKDTPLAKLVRSDDVADAVVFLASDMSASITGTDLNVSGGATMY